MMVFLRLSKGLVLSLVVSNIPQVLSWDCSIDPVQLAIQDNALIGGIVKNRGIQVVFPGNQFLGLRGSFTEANTRVRNDEDCQIGNKSEINACRGASGSTFAIDPPPTQNWTVLTDTAWLDEVNYTDKPLNGINAPTLGIAKVQFDSGPSVALPLEVWSDPAMQLVYAQTNPYKSVLGLGRNSSLLDRFLRGFYVPSTFLGLFFGSRSYSQPVDGELLIGGLDRSRVVAGGSFTNYTMFKYNMSIPCPLVVKVTRVTLIGQGRHEMIDGDPVLACIDLLQNQLTFTRAMYSKWAEATEHQNASDGGPPFTLQTYPASKLNLMQSLEIELDGGFIKTIPQYELVGPERGAVLNDVGEYGVVNNSRIMASVGTGTTDYGEDFGILLGGAFLAGTYLFADYERNTFGIATAVMQRSQSDIQRVCSLDESIPPRPSPSPVNPVPGLATNSPAAKQSSGLSQSDKIGLGVGVAFGMITVFGLIVGILQLKAMKRRRKQEHKEEERRLEEQKRHLGEEQRRFERKISGTTTLTSMPMEMTRMQSTSSTTTYAIGPTSPMHRSSTFPGVHNQEPTSPAHRSSMYATVLEQETTPDACHHPPSPVTHERSVSPVSSYHSEDDEDNESVPSAERANMLALQKHR